MNNIKKNLPVILVTVACTLFFVSVILLVVGNNSNTFSLKNSTNKVEEKKNNKTEVKSKKDVVEEKKENKEKENANKNVEEDKSISKTKQDSSVVNSDNTNKPIEETKSIDTSKNNNVVGNKDNNELSIVNYFVQEENRFNDTANKDENAISKLKSAFTGVVDFIFYDKEIKGHTFKELTTNAKLKVISLALSMDNKIDSYFPDYKYKIKESYTNLKGKLAVMYLEFTANLCDKVGSDACEQAKNDFSNMKDSFSLTFSVIKELAVSGSEKVKNFYETWRDK